MARIGEEVERIVIEPVPLTVPTTPAPAKPEPVKVPA